VSLLVGIGWLQESIGCDLNFSNKSVVFKKTEKGNFICTWQTSFWQFIDVPWHPQGIK